MIITKETCFWMDLPKLKRCMIDSCNVYHLILRNQYTKEIFLFKVRDFLTTSSVRYAINMVLPECMEYGEYEYFLISNDEWNQDEISVDVVKNTQLHTDKSLLEYDGMFFVSNNKILVTKNFKARIFFDGLPLATKDGEILVGNQASKDDNSEGDITKELTILNRGILKYENQDLLCCEPVKEYKSQTQTYKQYGK